MTAHTESGRPLTSWVFIGVEWALAALAGAVTTGSRPRRWLGLGIALVPLAVPFAMDRAARVTCFICALTALLSAIRGLDLHGDRSGLSTAHRMWHMVAIFDTRLVKRVERGVDFALLCQGIAWAALASVALMGGAFASSHATGTSQWLIRWSACPVFMVATFEGVTRLLAVGYRALGVELPPLHDRPYLSRSVAEFWGTRWNKVMGHWLRTSIYQPLARRRMPRGAIVATFCVSGLMHAYLVLPVLSGFWVTTTAAFFILQAGLMVVERRLGVRRWRPAAAHAWTVGALLLVSPLFTEPAAQFVSPIP